MNRIKAERYIYSASRPRTVIVGSSLTFNLPDAALGPDIFNLALAAVGPLTGLTVIERSVPAPDTVAVEVNFIYGGADAAFVADLFAPVLHPARGALLALRHEYQPVNVALSIARRAAGRSEDQRLAADSRQDVVDAMLAVHLREFSRSPQAAGLTSALDSLERLVEALKRKGVRVVFFEMPIHPELYRAPLKRAARDALLSRYPPGRHQWLDLQQCGAVETTDALHLTYRDALRVARVLRDALSGGATCAEVAPARPPQG